MSDIWYLLLTDFANVSMVSDIVDTVFAQQRKETLCKTKGVKYSMRCEELFEETRHSVLVLNLAKVNHLTNIFDWKWLLPNPFRV